jgi:hypothetical protein
MDEHEFDSRFPKPYTRTDIIQADARLRRCAMLAVLLWGRSAEDVYRQLLLPYPKVPADYDLAEFRELQQLTQRSLACLKKLQASSGTQFMSGGNQHSRLWEDRQEVLRRAIEYLEKRERP